MAMAGSSSSKGKSPKFKATKIQLRRSGRRIQPNKTRSAALSRQKPVHTRNAKVGLDCLPIEVFHCIMDHLDISSMLSMYRTCQDFRSKLCYERANFIWYKRLPPAILRFGERSPGRIERDYLPCLGGKYEDSFNYCKEVQYYFSENRRCDTCFVKNCALRPLRGMQWGRTLCEVCVMPLGICKSTCVFHQRN